ncbi:hypothetical protein Ddye_017400 [Dipteronia dyeriana]|uniref:NAC domain-containing protein n=1 Tax=Dipteronia dyeriana TaxID=168575 RepID=A0AAD9U964_9ROSI|nr:hypothetical protein Ddye_017400 [Dipteronia dyeriana]
MEDLVGYRFHPSDEEIVSYYLARKLRGLDFSVHVINEVDINKFEPWDLPDFAEIQSDDPVWYFFTKPDYMDAKRKRINRKTKAGFWKVTGRDRPVKDKRCRVIGYKRTLVFHLGRTPDGVGTHWVIQEFHYKDADKLYQRPFVLCRLKRKSDDGDEPSPPQLASNSGNYHNINIVPQENHELSLDLLSFLNNDEPDNSSLSAVQFLMDDEPDNSSLSAVQFLMDDELDNSTLSSPQFLMPTAQGPSCSNRSINVLEAFRSQLDTTEQDDDFLNSIWASDEDQHLHEENVQTRLHDFKPVKPLSGYIAESSNLPVEQSGSSRDGPLIGYVSVKQSGSSRYGPIVLQEDGGDSIWASASHEHVHEETVQTHRRHKQAMKPMEKPKEPEKKPREKPKELEKKPEKTKKPLSRKGSYIYLETPPWSHKQYPPSIYIANIVVSLILLLFFVREMVSLH